MDRDPFDLVGDVLDGQFRVEAFVGEGDLSVIYKGHHVGVDAPVAIKCLNLPATLDPALARPLVDGFKEASRLHYRLARGNLNIAQSIASGTTLAPRTGAVVPYLVREWFEGQSLAAELTARREKKWGGRPTEEALTLLEAAFDGIAYAHRQGNVHLSINPSNLFLAKRGDEVSLKVLDFGVARTMNGLVSGLPKPTRGDGGLRLLFPAYAAPEQFDRNVGELGPWTDVYSLALVVMEVLSDRLVMSEMETGAIVARALDEQYRPTPRAHGLTLPRDLDLVLARAVHLSPDQRQRNAGDLWDDIKNAWRATTLRPEQQVVRAPAPRSAAPSPANPPPASPPAAPAPLPPLRPRARTLTGMGVPGPGAALVAGAVGDRSGRSSSPSVETEPMSFEPAGASEEKTSVWDDGGQDRGVAEGTTANGWVAPAPSPVDLPQSAASLAALTVASPLPEQVTTSEMSPWGGDESPVLVLAAAAGALTWVALLAGMVLPWMGSWQQPQEPAQALVPSGVVAPAQAPPEATTELAPQESSEPAPLAHFPVTSARRALDAVSRDVTKCRRGKKWGVAFATVTFANDGSVDHVAVGAPFTGTDTGACVAEAMAGAHVVPFGDKPGQIVYRFYVGPR